MMQWSSTAEFFAMGGYALYVWGAYGLTAALIAIEVWAGARRRRRALEDARDAAHAGGPR
jgi:heme exporter protein D